MFKLFVFVFAVAGCKAGVLHHGYTAQIQSAPVIQQYVTEQHVVPQQQILSYAAPASVVETPLVYAAPIAEKKAPVMRQRQRKQKIEPAPESFSYQIRVQHAEKPQQVQQLEEQPEEEEIEYTAPVQQYQQAQQIQQVHQVQPIQHIQPLVQHYDYQPLQALQEIQLVQPAVKKQRPSMRRAQKAPVSARIQKPKISEKQLVQIPQIDDFQFTYTPLVYYYPDPNAGRRVNKKPVEPRPEPEDEEESGLETLDRYEAEEDAEEEEYESEVVVARAQPKQKLAKSTAHATQLNVNGQTYESPILAYQAFNARW